MVTYFNKKDLVSFGYYLNSETRKNAFRKSFKEDLKAGITNPLSVEDRMKEVYDADIENWKQSLKN